MWVERDRYEPSEAFGPRSGDVVQSYVLFAGIGNFLTEGVIPLIVADDVQLVTVDDFARLAHAVEELIETLRPADGERMDQHVGTLGSHNEGRVLVCSDRRSNRIGNRHLTIDIRMLRILVGERQFFRSDLRLDIDRLRLRGLVSQDERHDTVATDRGDDRIAVDTRSTTQLYSFRMFFLQHHKSKMHRN